MSIRSMNFPCTRENVLDGGVPGPPVAVLQEPLQGVGRFMEETAQLAMDRLEVALLHLVEEPLKLLLIHPPTDGSVGAVQSPGDPGHAPAHQEQRGDQ
jgi:hypothetical protein